MNTKQTDKHILKNKAIWKSTYQEAYIAKKKKKKKRSKTLEHSKLQLINHENNYVYIKN